MMAILARQRAFVLAALLIALSFAKVMPSLEKDRGPNTVGSMLQVLQHHHLFFMIDSVSSRSLPQRSLELESSGDYDAAMALLLQVPQPRQQLPGPLNSTQANACSSSIPDTQVSDHLAAAGAEAVLQEKEALDAALQVRCGGLSTGLTQLVLLALSDMTCGASKSFTFLGMSRARVVTSFF
jgi:hypothetical protein